MPKRFKQLKNLKGLNATPGLLSTRYLPGANKAQIRRLVGEPRKDFFAKRVTRRNDTGEERSA